MAANGWRLCVRFFALSECSILILISAQTLLRSTAIAGNGSHIGAVGDLERKTSDYRHTSLDVLPFNLPHKPLLL